MMKIMRIVCCVLACISAAAAVPVGILFEWYCFIPLGAAFLFTGGMYLFKRKQEQAETPEQPDFMKSDEENERINRDLKQ